MKTNWSINETKIEYDETDTQEQIKFMESAIEIAYAKIKKMKDVGE